MADDVITLALADDDLPSLDSCSEAVLAKARTLRAERRDDGDEDWWVEGTSGRYWVHAIWDEPGRPLAITCTCPYGRHRGAGPDICSHAAAVMLATSQ